MGFQIPIFSLLDKNEGLPKLDRNTGQDNWITEFQKKKPDQPNFVINRADWAKLARPEIIHGQPHDVFALVFCYAIDGNKWFYFRVRKILKLPNDEKQLFVDTKNIAYVHVGTALENQRETKNNPDYIPLSCLRFPNLVGEIDKVNNEVSIFKKTILQTNFAHNPPRGTPPTNCDIIQEGNIFGKHRIWDDILTHQYPNVNYVTVNFAYDGVNHLHFVFNINPDYVTNGIQCPLPQACHGGDA